MKEKFKNKKLIIFAGCGLAVIIAVVVAACLLINGKYTGNKVIDYLIRQVYSEQLIDVGNPNDDVGVMIMDCDNTDNFKETQNLKISNREGKYLQGTGAFTNAKFQTDLFKGVMKESVDISKYEKKSVHISLYVADKDALKNEINFELSSTGACDADELQWIIPKSVIENGWNEYYLSIPQAMHSGNPDLTGLNFFRVFSADPSMGIQVILDNVYACNVKGTSYEPDAPPITPIIPDAYKETSAKNGKMIMSCNTVNIFSALEDVKVTVKKGEFVEGTGAFKSSGTKDCLGRGLFAKPVDISKYENGKLHLSLYVNDVSLVRKSINLEFSSAGMSDTDEYEWIIEPAALKNGWNELTLSMSEVQVKSGKLNLNKINFFRLFTVNRNEKLITILDNVYVSDNKDSYKETESPYGKMIMSCNTVNIFKSLDDVAVTVKKGEFVEGTGAFKSTGVDDSLGKGVFAKPVNLSAYATGKIHLSLYINDVSLLSKPINFELSSSGKSDVNEHEWEITASKLKNGWNEVWLDLSQVTYTSGKPNMSAINFFRLFTVNRNKKLITILDNVYAVASEGTTFDTETTSPYGQMIFSGNTLSVFKYYECMEVTSVAREYVEGTGALKTVGYQDSLGNGVLAKAADISAYANGYVHVSLYVSDVSLLRQELHLELSSSGKADTDECEWFIAKGSLKDGWNEIYLPVNAPDAKEGNINLKAVNYFRIFTLGQKQGLVTIIDNVYATNTKDNGLKTACGQLLNAGDIMMANCTCYFSDSFNIALTSKCKEGTFAYKAKNPEAGMYGKFQTAVDISGYKDGYVHIWLYINDMKYLRDKVNFELSSSGTCNQSEYEWVIAKNQLKSGWNELILPMKDAFKTGTMNLKAVNYFRIFTTGADSKFEIILDDVYAG